jgi:hypothetical protein
LFGTFSRIYREEWGRQAKAAGEGLWDSAGGSQDARFLEERRRSIPGAP